MTPGEQPPECLFCKIAHDSTITHVLFQDATTLCILDAAPIVTGHCLVIPRVHVESITEADEKLARDLMATARYAAKLLQEQLGASGVNIMYASGIAQQDVPHLHIHVVPRYENDGLELRINKSDE